MVRMQKLIFCFPYNKGAGGVNMMFMRLASHLHKLGYSVALIDYVDGDMAKNKDEHIELIPYYDEKEVVIPENSIVIFQSMTPWSIYPSLKMSDDTKLFFITTLPANFYPVLPGFLRNLMYEGKTIAKFIWHTILSSEYQKSKFFLNLIEQKDSHAILDTDIVCNLQQSLNIKITNPKILPLFSQDVESNLYLKQDKKNDTIELGWVGRLADFKINILNHTIKDAFDYANKNEISIVFSVVGGGAYEQKLLNLESKYFSIKKISYIKPLELTDFMLSLDMLFAMGTTALDGAKIGLPTVRLDYSYSEIPLGYKYKFFHEVQGYSMGEKIESSCFSNGKHSFDEFMFIWQNNRNKLSQNMYNSYLANHSISNSSQLLIKYLSKSSLIYKTLKTNNLLVSLFYDIWKKIKR